MLTTIIKRNGVSEDFDAKKVNKWVMWAAEHLMSRIDWSSIVMEVVKTSPHTMTSQDFQLALAKKCVSKHSWPYSLMGGKLYAVWCWKEFYGDRIPTVKDIDTKLAELGVMKKLNYTDAEYQIIESLIDHTRDLKLAEFQIKQDINKYALTNKKTGVKYETPQFIFMRMAMALAENDTSNMRMVDVTKWYEYFSDSSINPPTPNFHNLGTPHNGYASCCLYKAGDDRRSLGVGKHIAYTMTYMSAGIGGYIEARSLGDGVASNTIVHQGKLPMFAGNGKDVREMTKGGRGGAATQYITCYDPEIITVMMLQNPRTSQEIRNRDIHFAVMYNSFLAVKAGKNEKIFTFNVKTAPDLHKAIFSGDRELFKSLYEKYEADESFIKNYIDASELVVMLENQGHEVSTLYSLNIEEVNRHTPHKDTIWSSNLCAEITQPTSEYEHITDLYKTDDSVKGEVSLCNLAGIVVSKIPFTLEGDKKYEEVAYYAVKMADTTTDMAEYELPHLGYTASRRRNIAIGMLGNAEVFARMGLPFDCPAGLELAHKLAERHAYFVIKASLRLGRERGNAPWMHKTKWPEGWLPIDTYKKSVDTLTPHVLRYDWETLRSEIIANGGIRNSSLIAHMPTESSSKASGVPNGIYPIRDFYLKKTDQDNVIDWLAPDDDIYGEQYQNAYDIDTSDMIKYYAVNQKFTDQSISADYYENRITNPVLNEDTLRQRFIDRVRYGVKSKYYQNSLTPREAGFDEKDKLKAKSVIPETTIIGAGERADCSSGACTL